MVIEICKSLRDYDLVPEVFHFGNPWLSEICDKCGLTSVIVPHLSSYKSIKTLPLFGLAFYKFLKNRQIDILHSHLVDPIAGACASALAAGIPHVGTLHDSHTIMDTPAKRYLLQFAAAMRTKLITVSKDVENVMRDSTFFLKKACTTIYNGVDLDKFGKTCNGSLRRQLNLSPDQIILTCVGRLVPVKGHELLLRALSEITPTLPCQLLMVGEGPERPNLERMIYQLNLADRVQLLGLRTDIPDLLGISDCFVLSSHSEGLSCSIIEAMASRLPVVATDVGGNYELVQNGLTGYLVPPDNPLALADKLENLLISQGRRRNMGEAGRKRVEDHFSLAQMTQNYVELYKESLAAST